VTTRSERAPAGPGREAEEPAVGDLAIVLHSHMPYVEGFGTYPFGEEWLFDAFARSHLPVLEVADRLTMTVTPVLADQLEAPGVGERMLAFLREFRLGSAERDAAGAAPELRAAAESEARRSGQAIDRLEALGDSPLAAFQRAAAERGLELMSSAATHAVLPKLATLAGRRLQVDAGLRSHARRFGAARGFWLPECAWAQGVESVLAERGIAYTCLDQSRFEPPGRAHVPVRLPGGPVGFTIDWPAVELVWSMSGYPSAGEYLDYHRLSHNGIRLWSISGEPYSPEAAERRARADAKDFLASVRGRLESHRGAEGRRGLCVFAVDTELLGDWWAEGPEWLAAVVELAEAAGLRMLTLPEAMAAHEAEERPVHEGSWGEGKSLETWDSPAVSDMVWGARRLELRLLRAVRSGALARASAERAARELLAVQSSDWAFMDHRRQAGDYAYRRTLDHAEALLEAINSPDPPRPALRALAPDISLAPLLEP
jgi:1,4-alpha-glucan branching enzyme